MNSYELEKISAGLKLLPEEEDEFVHIKRCLSCNLPYSEREVCPEEKRYLCIYETDGTPYYD